MEEEKIAKQKPHTSFNRRLSVAKNPEGNMTTAKKNFILQGTWQRGNMAKGITLYDCHTKQGSHLKIEPTWEELNASGFKWDCMYSDVKMFWHKWEICQISAGKFK